jgi:hypothetical protein
MKQSVFEQRKLIANFLANIGVAWFAAGVIGIFVNKVTDLAEVVKSLFWGIGFSMIFVVFGAMIITRKKRKWIHQT